MTAAVDRVAISHHVLELLESIHEPNHFTAIDRDCVAHVLLGDFSELRQADEHLVGTE
jgi:hypothetical protein